jgi:phosphate transport system permease protein
MQRLASLAGNGFLLAVTSASALAVLFIFFYIGKEALPFFRMCGIREFFAGTRWYPSADDAEFGALAIIYGSAMVTFGAVTVAVPLGVSAAVCLSDIVPFAVRQAVKPVVEILAAIPSVAYGFFALVVFAPLLQDRGGTILAAASWVVLAPVAAIAIMVFSDTLSCRLSPRVRVPSRVAIIIVMAGLAFAGLLAISGRLGEMSIASGTNALNVSIILGVMALPTVVSVSEDALQAVGRELREGSYALGATRAETMMKVVVPAAISGICAAVILGVMRAVGETMVVWMASGNSAKIPEPWYNLLEPVRTLTATIAGDMGEADHVTGSARYHVLFALALVLLSFSFGANMVSEWIMRRSARA